MKRVLSIIRMDLAHNQDIKNHWFFCIFRVGNMCVNADTVIAKICSIIFRLIMKVTYNKYNHIPLEIAIGGGIKITPLIGDCFIWRSINWRALHYYASSYYWY